MKLIRIEKLDDQEASARKVETWGIWEKEPSEFDWAYTQEEHCYVIEGRAEIETADEVVTIEKGDYVVFPVGLTCRWKVLKGIKKYYDFR